MGKVRITETIYAVIGVGAAVVGVGFLVAKLTGVNPIDYLIGGDTGDASDDTDSSDDCNDDDDSGGDDY